jgi:CRP/FNR family cyclic AMP-dependent transcriptional regulator
MDENTQPCRVLDEDPELAEAIPGAQRENATRECLAHCISIPAGRWLAESQSDLAGEAIGLLVLSGLLIRRVGVDGRFGAELLGAGDLLRPWQGEEDPPTLPLTTGWRIIEPARMAILDEPFAHRATRYPMLTGRLVGRAMQRSHNLAVNMAIVNQTRVDIRLQMLFWHLARRWGRVRADGVFLPLPLTHTVLADLTASRRPTVTTALSELAREELLQQTDEGWLLFGKPPGELLGPFTLPPAPPTGDNYAR